MKKTFIFTMCCIFIFSLFSTNIKAQESNYEEVQLNIAAPSAILMEYSTGKIIYSKNEKAKMYPASMTKMMAIYLFLETIEKGEKSFSDIVNVSTLASSMGGSQIFLKENEKMSFEDLFKAVTIASANDAVVALAEYTYGSLDEFINEMNSRSKEFGMNHTNFVNVTGFHDPNHYTTAYDMSLLAQKLLKDYKDSLLKYTSIYDTYIREDTSSPFWLVNTNRMLKFYNGMDGLKTGYTSDSGFNLSATASRNGLRFISIVMGGETSKSRNQDTSTLLDYGFNNFKSITLYKESEDITSVDFYNAKTSNDSIIAKEDVNIIVKKNVNVDDLTITIDIENIDSPKTTNDKIGIITIKDKSENILAVYELYPKNNIEKLSFFDLLLRYIKQLI